MGGDHIENLLIYTVFFVMGLKYHNTLNVGWPDVLQLAYPPV